jgi:hypothetical protein
MKGSQVLMVAGLAAAFAVSAPPAFAQRHGGGSSRGAASSGRVAGGAPVRQAGPRAGGVAPGVVSRGYYGGRLGYGYGVAPIRFYRPYYAFRPRVSLGFGLWGGYPFAYPYAFYDPFYSPYGYYSPYWSGSYTSYGNGRCDTLGPNGYPPYGCSQAAQPYAGATGSYGGAPLPGQTARTAEVGVKAGQANTGGMSFEIMPNTADLFVDDVKVGTVGQFTPTSQPLGVEAGHHRVDVRADGYQTMSFDVDIIPGQVTPYQGSMVR